MSAQGLELVEEVGIAEAAMTLRRTWHSVYALLLTGRLRGRREGRRWLVDAESVEQFRASEQHGAGDERPAA